VTRGFRLAVVAAMAAGLVAAVPAAHAKDGDVVRRGACGAVSNWKLKLSPENGRVDVEFEVDQNKVGRRWKVTLKRNGVRFFRGFRTTAGPSGSFEVRRIARNGAGPDHFFAKARNVRSGERCLARATF
jgi:catechol 2,3-dioxygenase-like lactoylglutathione lyase family enzyme